MREWLRSLVVIVLVLAGWSAFYHLASAGSIQPLGNQATSSGGGSVSNATASGSDGIQINGSQNVTATQPFLFDLAGTVTFNTLTSDAGQPITLNGATGTVIIDASDVLVVTAISPPGLSNLTFNGGGDIIFDPSGADVIVQNLVTLNTNAIRSTSNNTTLTLEGQGTGGVDVNDLLEVGSLQTAGAVTAASGAFGSLTATSAIITGLTFTTATGTTLTTSNATISALFTSAIFPRVGSTVTIISPHILAVNEILSASGNSTLTLSGDGTAGVDVNDYLEADSLFVIGTAAAATGLFGSVDTNAISSATNNTTLTLTGDGTGGVDVEDLLEVSSLQAIGSVTAASGAFGSLTAPAATITTLTFTTASGTTLSTTNVSSSNVFVNNVFGLSGGTPVDFRNVEGIKLSDDAGSNGSTFTPAAATLTLDVDGTGAFTLAAGDTLRSDAIESTTNNATLTLAGRGSGGVDVNDLLEASVMFVVGDISAASARFGSSITTNVTAGALFTSAIFPRAGSLVTILSPATLEVNTITTASGNTTMTLTGSGTGGVDVNDLLEADSLFVVGNATVGSLTSGALAASTIDTNAISSLTNNTTVTIAGDGTGGVDVNDLLEVNSLQTAGAVTAASGAFGPVTFTTATGTAVTTTNATATNTFTDAIFARTAATAIAINNVEGVTISDDANASASRSTLVPSANKLKLSIDGAGTFELDNTETLQLAIMTGNAGAIGINETSGVNFGDDAGSNASKITGGTASLLTVDVNGSGVLTVLSGDSFASNAIASTTNNTSLTLTGTGTGGVDVNDLLEADAIFVTGGITAASGAFGPITGGATSVTTLAFTTATGTTLTTTNVTTTNAFVDTIAGRTLNTTVTLAGQGTGGVQVIAGELLQFDDAIGDVLTVTSLGAGTLTANSATITTLAVTTLTSTNVTATNVFTDVLFSRTGGAIDIREASGIQLSQDNGGNATSLVPTAGVLTINVGGTGSLTIASGDVLTTNNVSVDQISSKTAAGRINFDDTDGIAIGKDNGADRTTIVPDTNVLTFDVGGTGSVIIASGDQLQANRSVITDMRATISTIVTSNATTTRALNASIDTITGFQAAHSVEIAETLGLGLATDTRTNTSTLIPTANTLSVNVDGASGSLQLASGDQVNADKAFITTVNATTTATFDAQVDSITARSAVSGAAVEVNETNGLAIASDTRTNTSTIVSTANNLTINANGTTGAGAVDLVDDMLGIGQIASALPANSIVGSIWYDTTNMLPKWRTDAGRSETLVGATFNSTVDTVDISAAAETEFDSSAQYTIPTSEWINQVGRKLRITLQGTYTGGAAGQSTVLRFRLNSTSVLGSNTQPVPNLSAEVWKAIIEFKVISTGATGTIFGTVHSWFDNNGAPNQDMSGGTSGAIDLTGSQTLKITNDWTNTPGGQLIRIKSMVVEVIN